MGAYGGPLTMILSNQLIGISNYGNQLPRGFALYPNYPNPFNPSTTISYDIPLPGFISLKVYDVLGRQISTLVNEFQQAGRHTVKFKDVKLSSGVYFYKLFYSNISITGKMILSK
jgi:hypothetical protein